ncbi:MAG: cytochrome c biogenesis protein CcsA [Bacteroidota bacterium]
MVGSLLVKIAFITALFSAAAYLQYHRKGHPQLLKLGRAFYHTTVVGILLTAFTLLYLILTHQFQYTYVWSYSSRELSLPLLISTFYAGQEGSFMLWTLFTAIVGVFLLRYSSRKGGEPQVMSVFALITLVLLLMLVIKSPFLYVWETWPHEVDPGIVPADGRGLNPLLQNYWMVIHPQVLFSGFAAMAVPYAYAVAALMRRDYTSWIRPAAPWLVFGSFVLGLGIILGGFWAYETLGWGGYWGWDPVENSSLVPWLVSVATIHMMLSQRKNGTFVKTNLVLSMLCFVTVLYSTFLTRSGVLGDTSVHSFVDPGMLVYWFLVGTIVLFVGIGGWALKGRWREIPRPHLQYDYFSTEFALFLGAAALVAGALLITAGTSSPLITDILYGAKSAVDISYYPMTIVPLGIAIGLLAGVGQLLWWHRSDRPAFWKSLLPPAVVALAATAGVFLAVGLNDLLIGLFVFGALFALFANASVAYRIFKGNPKYAGGAVAHIGVAIMFVGFVASSEYDREQTLSLREGELVEALGFTLTYTGYRPIGGEKFAFQVTVEKDGRVRTVAPVMYYSSYNDGLMRNPDILNLVTSDFYLAPLALEPAGGAATDAPEESALKMGGSRRLRGLDVTFLGLSRPLVQKASLSQRNAVTQAARIMVDGPAGQQILSIPFLYKGAGVVGGDPVNVSDRVQMAVVGVSLNEDGLGARSVSLRASSVLQVSQVGNEATKDILVVKASVKPWINLVWSGVIILLVGFLVTVVRRAQEASRTS